MFYDPFAVLWAKERQLTALDEGVEESEEGEEEEVEGS